MKTPSFRFTTASLVAVCLAVAGPGLSGYEAAAQVRAAAAPAVEFSAAVPVALGAGSSFAAAPLTPGFILPLGSLPSLNSLQALPGASMQTAPLRAAEARAGLPAAGSSAASASTALSAARSRAALPSDRTSASANNHPLASWQGRSDALTETLAPVAKLGSMETGSARSLGSDIEAAMTGESLRRRSGDVQAGPYAGLGSLRSSAAPSFASPASAPRGLAAVEDGPRTASAAQLEAAAFTSKVYGWMSGGLGVTALTAYTVASQPGWVAAIYGSPAILIGLVVAELALVIGLSLALRKLSFGVAAGGFLAYAALNGVTLSGILLAYTAASVTSAFVITSGMFAGMALFGAFTKKNLNGVGAMAGMALWGLILASIVNLFLKSSGLDFVVSLAGVLVFTALTAYDAQKIKEIAESGVGSKGSGRNLAILGALALYLDFINLFLYILKLIGKAKSKD